MEIVNGFQCKNCTDIDLAKKGIDPAHPKLADGRPATPSNKEDDKREVAVRLGINQPNATGSIGTKVSIFA